MLIDEHLPVFDFVERHSIDVDAPAARIYSAIRSANLIAHPVIKALLGIRALPAALLGGRRGMAELGGKMSAKASLGSFEKQGFAILAEEQDQEILLGVVGEFWKLSGNLQPANGMTFANPPAGMARVAWNFSIDGASGGRNRLLTETRIHCPSEATRRRFGYYWAVVRPGSGLIRRMMLRTIKREAEGR